VSIKSSLLKKIKIKCGLYGHKLKKRKKNCVGQTVTTGIINNK